LIGAYRGRSEPLASLEQGVNPGSQGDEANQHPTGSDKGGDELLPLDTVLTFDRTISAESEPSPPALPVAHGGGGKPSTPSEHGEAGKQPDQAEQDLKPSRGYSGFGGNHGPSVAQPQGILKRHFASSHVRPGLGKLPLFAKPAAKPVARSRLLQSPIAEQGLAAVDEIEGLVNGGLEGVKFVPVPQRRGDDDLLVANPGGLRGQVFVDDVLTFNPIEALGECLLKRFDPGREVVFRHVPILPLNVRRRCGRPERKRHLGAVPPGLRKSNCLERFRKFLVPSDHERDFGTVA
jgi:hypothetical protein